MKLPSKKEVLEQIRKEDESTKEKRCIFCGHISGKECQCEEEQ